MADDQTSTEKRGLFHVCFVSSNLKTKKMKQIKLDELNSFFQKKKKKSDEHETKIALLCFWSFASVLVSILINLPLFILFISDEQRQISDKCILASLANPSINCRFRSHDLHCFFFLLPKTKGNSINEGKEGNEVGN